MGPPKKLGKLALQLRSDGSERRFGRFFQVSAPHELDIIPRRALSPDQRRARGKLRTSKSAKNDFRASIVIED